MSFGNYIREERKKKALSLRELAKRSGMSHPYLSQLETGKNKNPTPDMVRKLAKGLNIKYPDLLKIAGHIDDKYLIIWLDEVEDGLNGKIKPVTIHLPGIEYIENDGITETKVINEDELKKRLFDLHDYLQLDVDLYYKGKILTNEQKQKIKTMLKTLLE